MAGDIDRAGVAKAYGRWAPIYDLVFGKVFDHGRQSTIAEADKIGGRILDVGVGTGLSLSDYSPTTRLCGVDISEPMLRKAQQRVRAMGLSNVETLAVMDAKNLAFPDSFFDAVVAQYVITAVPDPERTLDDFIRVLKPGGELILVNHIGAESGPRRLFELAFAPLARRLGWRPEFPWARLVDWAAKHGGVSLTERRPMPPMGHFSLIRYRVGDMTPKSGNLERSCPKHEVKSAAGGTSARAGRFPGMQIKPTLLLSCVLVAVSSAAAAQAPPVPATPPSDRAAIARTTLPVARRRKRRRRAISLLREPPRAKARRRWAIGWRNPTACCARRRASIPQMRAPAPSTGTSSMPVIPPPGSPGGDPNVRPK